MWHDYHIYAKQIGCLYRHCYLASFPGAIFGAPGNEANYCLVSQPRLSRAQRESGQIPIIISFLTCQEFLGVLIDLGTNGGTRLPFSACLQSEA